MTLRASILLLAFFSACGSPKKESEPPQTPTSTGAAVSLKSVPTTTERRLYAEELEASSFLDQQKNTPRDRYHPNYAMDDNPLSAWNEGAETSGAGEWLKIPVTMQKDVDKVRLRFLNGYQKSENVFQNNARIKTMQVTFLPGKETQTFTLEDKMDWQEKTLTVLAPQIEAIELKAVEVYEGKKFKDLALSEVEVFVSSMSKETPEIEAEKHTKLLDWIQAQKDALLLMESEGIFPSYYVERETKEGSVEGFNIDVFHFLPEETREYEKKSSQMAMVPVTLSSTGDPLPSIEGWSFPCNTTPPENTVYDGINSIYEVSEKAFSLPCSKELSLFTSVTLSAKKTKATKACDVEYYVPEEELTKGSILRRIEIRFCMEYMGNETRSNQPDREIEAHATQILLYDQMGKLRMIRGDRETAWLDWRKDQKRWLLVGGLRINEGYTKPPIDRLIAGKDGVPMTSLPLPEPEPTSASLPASSSPTRAPQ